MKKILANWDFSQYASTHQLKQQLLDTNFKAHAAWILPQLLAYIGSKIPLAKGEHGWGFAPTLRGLGSALDAGAICHDNGVPISKLAFQGMLNVLNYSPRGDILPANWRQSSGEGLRYAAAVPLFLSAFKEYRDIKYSEWDWQDDKRVHFLDKDMMEYSSQFYKPVEWSTEELLEFREEGRTVRSGTKAGTQKPLIATTTLTGLNDPDFKVLPRLLKLALCQVWVYHPTIRHKYMITNHLDLDQHPEPLVADEVFVAPKSTTTTSMWDV